jgi:putative hydrolase of the HAD superfamily
MFPFDVILFDVGGVLLTNGWDTGERALAAEHFNLDLAGFEQRHHAVYPAWERGDISIRAYLDATVFNESRRFTPYEFFGFMLEQSKLLADGALGTLEELAASNKCLLGALNNEARETNEYRFKTFGLRNYFKLALSSCYLGLRKPDAAIYERALDILGRPAKRVLFIDDRTENVNAAMQVGLKAIRFDGSADLRHELTRMGVL